LGKRNIEEDLSLTIQELSNTYEELSLLYRMSEVFSTLSVDEICKKIVHEATETIGVATAAILFLDEMGSNFYTKISIGNWDDERQYAADTAFLGEAIKAKKSFAVCSLTDSEYGDIFPELSSVMACPILGKKRPIGVIVIGNKLTNEEFYAKDSKILMALTVMAGFAIENALLYREQELILIGSIGSLVKALEASSEWTAGHTERVTEYAIGIGRSFGLNDSMIDRLRITGLLHDIGKIATPDEILNKSSKLDENEWTEIKKHPDRGVEILKELKNVKDIISSIKYHHEYWDGSDGIFGLSQEAIPLMARIIAVADAFDALTSDRPYRQKKLKDVAVSEISRCSGTQFDPEVVEAFKRWVKSFNPQH
jgi:putative nucleotidyltransferase with HDIG domain